MSTIEEALSSRSAKDGTALSLPVARLRADPNNPRHHSLKQVRAIARSIEAFGFNAPILIDRDRQIVAGHGRLEAAKLLRLEEVPVICLDHLNKSQAKAYMIADNKLTDRSSWDDQQLALQLKELSDVALDFEVEALGFELPELDLRIQSLGRLDELVDDDPAPSVGPSISQPGDLWLLGDDHRLFCGSALEEQSYEILLGSEKAAAVFTDPPYNVKIGGHVCGTGGTKHREFAMASGEMSSAQFTSFLRSFLACTRGKTTDGAVLYVCMDWRHMSELLEAAQTNDLELLNLCIWVKTNGGMGSLYRSQHELIFVFRNGKEGHCNNVQLGRFGRNRTNVWHYEGTNSFGSATKGRARTLHPTMKPISLVADALLDVTKRGQMVLDPFVGSGTTILAAERTGRRAFCIEMDPVYVDTTIVRWQRQTGCEARLASGQTFLELSAARRGRE